MNRLKLALKYWWARLRTGYGPIRLKSLDEGTITVSVLHKGNWVPVIAEFRNLDGCTIDHSVSEIEIAAQTRRPYYSDPEDDAPGSWRRKVHTRRRRNRRNP